MMESLADILSGAEESAPSETTSTPAKVETTDVKPDTVAKTESTAAPSAAKTPEAPAEKVAPTETAEQAAERTRNEKGQFAKPDEIAGLQKGLQKERQTRQDTERKLQEAERKLREIEAKKTDEPKKDFWEDPDAALEERLTEREKAIRLESESRYFSLCEDLAKKDHTDYDDVVNELLTEAQEDASLGSQVFAQAKAARNPAEFLYTYAINRREMKAVGGDLGKYKESIAAEFKPKLAERDQKIATLEGEIKALKTQLDNLGKVPSSLNGEPSASRAAVTTESVENEPLGEIFKPRKRRA